MAAATRALLVDIHTHVYLPRYASYLRGRTSVPRILSRALPGGGVEDRLVILDDEPSGGRPVGPQYWDRNAKLAFMDKHGIDVSVISTANPWLDPLPASEAITLATELNTDMEEFCSSSPSFSPTLKRLYGLGLLPLLPSVPTSAIISTIAHIHESLPHLKGVIIGTRGLGKGLDDPELDAVWEAVERSGLVVFLHPHYGVGGGKEWGDNLDNGHVLPLALGFPMETTIAATRLILSGVYDRYPNLKILLAHSGGCLPQLSSRLASCITHDPQVAKRLKNTDVRYYLGKMYFDAVSYGAEELEFVSAVIGRAERHGNGNGGGESKIAAEVERKMGSKRMMWGTDHPFFPPIEGEADGKWQSVTENLEAIENVAAWGDEERRGVRGGNAIELFGLLK